MTHKRENTKAQNHTKGVAMDRMNEGDAIDAGLTTFIEPGIEPETPAEAAERASLRCDELAALAEGLLADGVNRSTLMVIRDSLGALHVEFDMLAEELRHGDPTAPRRTSVGVVEQINAAFRGAA